MIVGVPKEIKNHEYRVGLTPASVRELVTHGHTVLVEANAGLGIGMDDAAYIASGARIVGTPEQVFAGSEMIVKVKEPQPIERQRLTPNHILFTYLHLAPDPEQTEDLLASGALCIAYETVTSATDGCLACSLRISSNACSPSAAACATSSSSSITSSVASAAAQPTELFSCV